MNKTYDYENIMSYDVFNDDIKSIGIDQGKKIIVNCMNPHSYIVAKKDEMFKKSLLSSDILLPDGSGFVLAARLLKNKSIKKIAGNDFHLHILDTLNRSKGSVFYMGASQKTLNFIHKKISNDFPNINVGSYSPPFKDTFSVKDNDVIFERINSFSPDVLFIGMTAPKQEKWLYQNMGKLNFRLASSIGAVFDFYAGTIKRPSKIWIKLHLEWLARFLNEPKRLFKRNFISTPLFLVDLVCSYFKKNNSN